MREIIKSPTVHGKITIINYIRLSADPLMAESACLVSLILSTSFNFSFCHIKRFFKYKFNSQYLKVKVHLKLLISQSKFSVHRKFTLRYQQFEIT